MTPANAAYHKELLSPHLENDRTCVARRLWIQWGDVCHLLSTGPACTHWALSQHEPLLFLWLRGQRGGKVGGRREGMLLVTCPASLPASWLRRLEIQGWSEAHCHLVHAHPPYAYNTHRGPHFLPVQKLPHEGRDYICLIHPVIPWLNPALTYSREIFVQLMYEPKPKVHSTWGSAG